MVNNSSALQKRDIKLIAESRLADADLLYEHGRYDAAVYLCGYAIELALKARICERLGWNEFPPSELKDIGQKLKTHNLQELAIFGGVQPFFERYRKGIWKEFVTKWSESLRYKQVGSASKQHAQEMIFIARNLLPFIYNAETTTTNHENDKTDQEDQDPAIVKHVREFMLSLSDRYGEFIIFGLFERVNWRGVYDLAFSAEWITKENIAAITDEAVALSKRVLSLREQGMIAGIAVWEVNDPAVLAVRLGHEGLSAKQFPCLGQNRSVLGNLEVASMLVFAAKPTK